MLGWLLSPINVPDPDCRYRRGFRFLHEIHAYLVGVFCTLSGRTADAGLYRARTLVVLIALRGVFHSVHQLYDQRESLACGLGEQLSPTSRKENSSSLESQYRTRSEWCRGLRRYIPDQHSVWSSRNPRSVTTGSLLDRLRVWRRLGITCSAIVRFGKGPLARVEIGGGRR